jgi:hypothetical protein
MLGSAATLHPHAGTRVKKAAGHPLSYTARVEARPWARERSSEPQPM